MFNAQTNTVLDSLSAELPVLIAGPTASGKSALALKIAERQGGVVINADALQVFSNWRVLTARPDAAEETRAQHKLYGHIPGDQAYSVGHWLRDVSPHVTNDARPIIVGGTGLYFKALTDGLADIPETPAQIRADADTLLKDHGIEKLLRDLDATTLARIDQRNPMRVQRAWEVMRTTGKGLAKWQDATPAPLLGLSNTQPIVMDADRDWLGIRIEKRFDIMMAEGALNEARENLATWNPAHPSSKAIGAPELIAHLHGSLSLEDAIDRSKIATRQFAKRQRTWFRSKMKSWRAISLP